MDSLNAFRAALVAFAAIAMMAAIALGNVAAALWMLLAISLHSALWVHLWRTKKRDEEQVAPLDTPASDA